MPDLDLPNVKKSRKRRPEHVLLREKLRTKTLRLIDDNWESLSSSLLALLQSSSKDDGPRAQLWKDVLRTFAPEQREAQPKVDTAPPPPPAVLVFQGVSRGTEDARQEAIEVTNRRYAPHAISAKKDDVAA